MAIDTKGKRGRPPSNTPRSQISLTVSPELKAYLETQAEREGLNVSEYIRLKVFDSSVSRPEIISPVDILNKQSEPLPANWDEYRERTSHETYELSQKVTRWSDYLTARDRGFLLDEYRDKSKNQVPEYLLSYNQEQRYQFWDLIHKGMTHTQALIELEQRAKNGK